MCRPPSSLFTLSLYKSYISRIDFVWKCLVDSLAGTWAVSNKRVAWWKNNKIINKVIAKRINKNSWLKVETKVERKKDFRKKNLTEIQSQVCEPFLSLLADKRFSSYRIMIASCNEFKSRSRNPNNWFCARRDRASWLKVIAYVAGGNAEEIVDSLTTLIN